MAEVMKITGLKELENKLKELGPKVQKKVVRKAIREGNKVMLQAARGEAPKGETGALAKSLKIKTRFHKKSGTLTGIVQTSDKTLTGETYYGGFVELGTKFQEPNPWLERAFEKVKDTVLTKTTSTLKTGIETEAKKK